MGGVSKYQASSVEVPSGNRASSAEEKRYTLTEEAPGYVTVPILPDPAQSISWKARPPADRTGYTEWTLVSSPHMDYGHALCGHTGVQLSSTGAALSDGAAAGGNLTVSRD